MGSKTLVIDGHNHMGGPDRGDGANQTPEELVKVMDGLGVDKAVVFPFNEVEPGISFSKANDHIAEGVKRHPDRLIGFARLDPHFGERAVGELRRAVTGLGLRGLKLHPDSQDFTLDDPAVPAIMEEARRLRIPVIFDSGGRNSPPPAFAGLADAFRGVWIIMAHMRGRGYLEVARRFDNILLGTTGAFKIPTIKEAVEAVGAGRVVAGSDSPYIPMELEQRKIALIPGLGGEERTLILGENMRRLLEI